MAKAREAMGSAPFIRDPGFQNLASRVKNGPARYNPTGDERGNVGRMANMPRERGEPKWRAQATHGYLSPEHSNETMEFRHTMTGERKTTHDYGPLRGAGIFYDRRTGKNRR